MLQQKIILSNLINENEKLKSLALLGEKTFNTHYFRSLDLARYLLQLSGLSLDKKFISTDDLCAYLYEDIKAIDYFKKSSFNDISHLVRSINDLRHYIVKDENENIHNLLPKDIFVDKNEAIIEVYDLMMDFLNKNDYIDEIGIIRFALENTKSFNNIVFEIYEEQLPLDLALITKAAGKEVNRVDLSSDKKLKIKSYTKAFGQTNEIENILAYIYQNNIPFDQCLIASAETTDYPNLLNNYKDLLKFPLTIGTGLIIIETNPGKLFSIINDWIDSHYYVDYLLRIIKDECFDLAKLSLKMEIPEDDFKALNDDLEFPETISLDSIITTVGDLRISFEKEYNEKTLEEYIALLNKHTLEGYDKENTLRRIKELPFVKALVNELSEGIIYFISTYSLIRDIKDENALSKINKYLNYHFEHNVSYVDIKKMIFASRVGRESVKEGNLYFTSINNALSVIRPYLFITGLSSNNFPGGSKEDSNLLDRDYLPFGANNASNRTIDNNKKIFNILLNEANKYNVEIHLSYSYYNSESLKDQNASSVVFEAFKLENGNDKTIEDFEKAFIDNKDKYQEIEFFDKDILPISSIGRAISDNQKISFTEVEPSSEERTIKLNWLLNKKRGFSASTITNYAKCEYLFYLTQVLNIKQSEETDIYEIIPANEYGTMAHYLLETLDKEVVKNKEEFALIAGQRFDEYLLMHKPYNMVAAEKEKEEFINMMKIAYEMEGNEKTIFKEEDVVYEHPSGIKIHGFPDKVIREADDTVRVIDYKTGRSISHDSEDIPSMIQCTLYSYIIEHVKDMRVSSFEYRYIRHGRSVFSSDNDKTMTEHYQNLNETLKKLYQSLKTGVFTPNHKHCEDCYFKDVCMKRKK